MVWIKDNWFKVAVLTLGVLILIGVYQPYFSQIKTSRAERTESNKVKFERCTDNVYSFDYIDTSLTVDELMKCAEKYPFISSK